MECPARADGLTPSALSSVQTSEAGSYAQVSSKSVCSSDPPKTITVPPPVEDHGLPGAHAG